MEYIYKFFKILLVLLGVGLGAMAGRPLPLWRLLPVLLVALLLPVGGCSHYSYNASGVKASGLIVGSPEGVILATAEAKYREVEALALQTCAQDSGKCQAAYLSVGAGSFGAGWMDTPYSYTWAGVQATSGVSAPVAPAKPAPKKPKAAPPSKLEEKDWATKVIERVEARHRAKEARQQETPSIVPRKINIPR